MQEADRATPNRALGMATDWVFETVTRVGNNPSVAIGYQCLRAALLAMAASLTRTFPLKRSLLDEGV
jgi:hypothetical protein